MKTAITPPRLTPQCRRGKIWISLLVDYPGFWRPRTKIGRTRMSVTVSGSRSSYRGKNVAVRVSPTRQWCLVGERLLWTDKISHYDPCHPGVICWGINSSNVNVHNESGRVCVLVWEGQGWHLGKGEGLGETTLITHLWQDADDKVHRIVASNIICDEMQIATFHQMAFIRRNADDTYIKDPIFSYR